MATEQAPKGVSPATQLCIQGALLLVAPSQRARLEGDLNALILALQQGQDSEASAIVERYHLGANYAAILARLRGEVANGGQ